MSKTNLIVLPPNAVHEIRKMFNLDGPGRMEEAIEILEKWIQQENHILKKDFQKRYLEITLIVSKGSIEKAKKIIDALCTMRTVIPNLFTLNSSRADFEELMNQACIVALPTLTKYFHRVVFIKLPYMKYTPKTTFLALQYCIMFSEYLCKRDYNNGFIFLYDLQETNIVDFVTNLSMVDVQQFASILLRGYSCRIKAIHLISKSKGIELFKNIITQFLTNKLNERIHLHKNFEEIRNDDIPKDILPEEYGGKERSLNILMKEWRDAILSDENMNTFKLMSKVGTDEKLRQSGKFNEEYMGMPGSFRNLRVD